VNNRDYFSRRLAARKRTDKIFHFVFMGATGIGMALLLVLLADICKEGIKYLDGQFLTSFPSRFPERAGIKSALAGTLWLITLVAPLTFVFGVGTALFLEEFIPRKNIWNKIIQTNIANLAGVPSIIYGILGLAVFVRMLALGRSVLAGALTMTLLILPIVIVAAQEAIRSVPVSMRHASFALGATRWQTVRHVVFPSALPGILTGMILAVSRAIGETAPMIMIGSMAFVAFTPRNPLDYFTVLPIQIFNWTARPQDAFREVAASGIVVLLAVLLATNALAVLLRNRYQKKS
jgi:phosphate transport system permease protein